jgi:hypothetical protein
LEVFDINGELARVEKFCLSKQEPAELIFAGIFLQAPPFLPFMPSETRG